MQNHGPYLPLMNVMPTVKKKKKVLKPSDILYPISSTTKKMKSIYGEKERKKNPQTN